MLLVLQMERLFIMPSEGSLQSHGTAVLQQSDQPLDSSSDSFFYSSISICFAPSIDEEFVWGREQGFQPHQQPTECTASVFLSPSRDIISPRGAADRPGEFKQKKPNKQKPLDDAE